VTWTYLAVTLSGGVIARRPGNPVCKVGHRPGESAIPTAPEEGTEPLRINVYGLPVTKGVEEQKRPSFETYHYFREREREKKRDRPWSPAERTRASR
jgi:hypothetical protein